MENKKKVFYTNEVDEASEIKNLLSENFIESEILIRLDSPYWGNSNLQPMEEVFYKYTVVVGEKDSGKAAEIIESKFSECENND